MSCQHKYISFSTGDCLECGKFIPTSERGTPATPSAPFMGGWNEPTAPEANPGRTYDWSDVPGSYEQERDAAAEKRSRETRKMLDYSAMDDFKAGADWARAWLIDFIAALKR